MTVAELQLTTHGEAQTRRLGRALASVLVGTDVVALRGSLGAGKTCLVRGIAEGLGIAAREVSSPTFTIVQEYAASTPPNLVHMDAYRIACEEELESVGFDEIVRDPDRVLVIEWAERIESDLPEARIDIALEHAGEQERTVTVHATARVRAALAPQIAGVPSGEVGRCPTCRRTVDHDQATFPFCSMRCRQVDMGRWMGERYRL